MTLQKAIDECNDFVWGYQHTDHFPLAEGSAHHRDLVRTFFAGVFVAAPSPERRLIDFMRRMGDVEWVPGIEFERRSWEVRKNAR